MEEKLTKETFREEIEKLLQVQERDIKLNELFADKEEQPRRVAELRENFKTSGAGVEKAKEELKVSQAEVKKFELEVQANQEKIIKYSNQLFQVKTNEEYRALEKEIQLVKQTNSQAEDKILEQFMGIDEIKSKIKEREEGLAQDQNNLKEQEALIDERLKNIEVQIKQIQDERHNLEVRINPEMLSVYDRVFKKRSTGAIVSVDNFTCGGCFMSLTHQVVSDVKRGNDIVTCENCSRILYLS